MGICISATEVKLYSKYTSVANKILIRFGKDQKCTFIISDCQWFRTRFLLPAEGECKKTLENNLLSNGSARLNYAATQPIFDILHGKRPVRLPEYYHLDIIDLEFGRLNFIDLLIETTIKI